MVTHRILVLNIRDSDFVVRIFIAFSPQIGRAYSNPPSMVEGLVTTKPNKRILMALENILSVSDSSLDTIVNNLDFPLFAFFSLCIPEESLLLDTLQDTSLLKESE